MKFILAKKIGMSQMFDENGNVVPVTLIQSGSCRVIQKKTKDKDGYVGVQVGFEEIKESKLAKAQQGHFKKSESGCFRHLCEFNGATAEVGDEINVSSLKPGEVVKITGVSKGKGFQGVVKRYKFKGGPASHGQKHTLRSPGSIGCAFPERVLKGKKMAGRMGVDQVTVKGLKIARVDADDNVIAIKGAIPGRKGTLLKIVVTKEIADSK